MRKGIFMFVVFVVYSADAQVTSGTSIVFNFTKNKIVVAADSRGIHDDGTPPDNSNCKIAAFGHQFIFASVGNAGYTKRSPFDNINSWNNWDLAGDAVRNVPKERDSDTYMDALVAYWGKAVSERWNSLCRENLWKCMRAAEKGDGLLTAGVFIRAKDMLLRGAMLSFDPANPFTPVAYSVGKEMAQCWPCGQRYGDRICAAGSHIDIAAKFCSERKVNSKTRIRTPLPRTTMATRLPVKIVELTIKAYEKSAGDVGGDIDVIAIFKDGRIDWLRRKHDCPDNQH